MISSKLIPALIVSATIFFGFIVLGPSGYKPGDKAINFNLKNVDGEKVSLDGIKGAKGAIVVFTCNHCPFAKMYEKRIIELDKKYNAKGFPVVAINSNDSEAYPDDSFKNMVKRANSKSYTFPYLRDKSQSVAKAYGAKKTPQVFVLNKKNNEFYVEYIGAIDNNAQNAKKADQKYVEDAVEALLVGKSVTKRETKAIGCGIKWTE